MKQNRKRAPGGGRKPSGPFAQNAAQLTIRMPTEMRGQLEAAAQRRGRSLTQELLRRVQDSFNRERDKDRDPAMRALCFMIAELAHNTVGYHEATGGKKKPMFDWRSNPFFFRAFKIAVAKVLDALEPKGEIRAPEMPKGYDAERMSKDEEPGSLQWRWLRSYKTPEDRGQVAAEAVWDALQRLSQISNDGQATELQRIHDPDSDYEEFAITNTSDFYGFIDAARDLQLKPGKEKR